jgi:hypothetical protein
MNLQEQQQAFWAIVRKRGTPPNGLERLFRATNGLSALERMRIYHDAYWTRQLEILADSFEQLRARLGEERFAKLALDYLTAQPSNDPRVEAICFGVPAYIRRSTELAPELADLAAFECARLEALLAPDPLEIAASSDIELSSFANRRVQFVASLRVVELDARACLSLAGSNAGTRDRQTIAVWRKHFSVHTRALDTVERVAFDLAAAGQPMFALCEGLAQILGAGELVEGAARIVSGWLARHWVERFY